MGGLWETEILHGCDLGALLHDGAQRKPQCVVEAELVLEQFWLLNARVRISPLPWRDSAQQNSMKEHSLTLYSTASFSVLFNNMIMVFQFGNLR